MILFSFCVNIFGCSTGSRHISFRERNVQFLFCLQYLYIPCACCWQIRGVDLNYIYSRTFFHFFIVLYFYQDILVLCTIFMLMYFYNFYFCCNNKIRRNNFFCFVFVLLLCCCCCFRRVNFSNCIAAHQRCQNCYFIILADFKDSARARPIFYLTFTGLQRGHIFLNFSFNHISCFNHSYASCVVNIHYSSGYSSEQRLLIENRVAFSVVASNEKMTQAIRNFSRSAWYAV